MLKLIVWIAVIWLVYSLWRSARRSPAPQAAPAEQAALRMVACQRCGVYLPEIDAVNNGGTWYCGAEHARQGSPGARGR